MCEYPRNFRTGIRHSGRSDGQFVGSRSHRSSPRRPRASPMRGPSSRSPRVSLDGGETTAERVPAVCRVLFLPGAPVGGGAYPRLADRWRARPRTPAAGDLREAPLSIPCYQQYRRYPGPAPQHGRPTTFGGGGVSVGRGSAPRAPGGGVEAGQGVGRPSICGEGDRRGVLP
eukprot:gene18015-biopygen21908